MRRVEEDKGVGTVVDLTERVGRDTRLPTIEELGAMHDVETWLREGVGLHIQHADDQKIDGEPGSHFVEVEWGAWETEQPDGTFMTESAISLAKPTVDGEVRAIGTYVPGPNKIAICEGFELKAKRGDDALTLSVKKGENGYTLAVDQVAKGKKTIVPIKDPERGIALFTDFIGQTKIFSPGEKGEIGDINSAFERLTKSANQPTQVPYVLAA